MGISKTEFAFHPGTDTHHKISFWCNDIEATMTELRAKGVEFKSPVQDQGFGLVATFAMPGGAEVCSTSQSTPSRSSKLSSGKCELIQLVLWAFHGKP